ncbi:hypothetical protein E4T43_08735 [Aureobasidium subglaciale]|nr:hypothetical protein E4T43_08735 [Aureobasidium subglaciale]
MHSSTDNSHLPAHIKAYDYLIIRANNFLVAEDPKSAQRVARLLLRSPDISIEHQKTCHRILALGPDNVVFHTAKAINLSHHEGGDPVMITVTPPTPPPKNSPRRSPVKKDDAWLLKPPAPTPTKRRKRVRFAQGGALEQVQILNRKFECER